jgi:hypothetical protein
MIILGGHWPAITIAIGGSQKAREPIERIARSVPHEKSIGDSNDCAELGDRLCSPRVALS